jgi:hypothetical protein
MLPDGNLKVRTLEFRIGIRLSEDDAAEFARFAEGLYGLRLNDDGSVSDSKYLTSAQLLALANSQSNPAFRELAQQILEIHN